MIESDVSVDPLRDAGDELVCLEPLQQGDAVADMFGKGLEVGLIDIKKGLVDPLKLPTVSNAKIRAIH
jgi:hypothetical protein